MKLICILIVFGSCIIFFNLIIQITEFCINFINQSFTENQENSL